MASALIQAVLIVVALLFVAWAWAFSTRERARIAAGYLLARQRWHRAGIVVLAAAILMFATGEGWKAFRGEGAAWSAWMTTARLLLPVGAACILHSVTRPPWRSRR